MIIKTSTLPPLLLILTVIGVALPYAAFLPFIAEHGLSFSLFAEQIIATRISLFAWLDVIVAGIALLIVAFGSGLISLRQAIVVALFTCAAGGSAGLPLFFYFYFSNLNRKK